MLSLANEILYTIFTHLHPNDLLSFAQTCHDFNILSRDPHIWATLSYRDFNYPPDKFLMIMEKSLHQRKFSDILSSRTHILSSFFELLNQDFTHFEHCLDNIRSTSFVLSEYTYDIVADMEDILGTYNHLIHTLHTNTYPYPHTLYYDIMDDSSFSKTCLYSHTYISPSLQKYEEICGAPTLRKSNYCADCNARINTSTNVCTNNKLFGYCVTQTRKVPSILDSTYINKK